MGTAIKPKELTLAKATVSILNKMTDENFNKCLLRWNLEAQDNRALITTNKALQESNKITINSLLEKNANLAKISTDLNVELKSTQALLKLKL